MFRRLVFPLAVLATLLAAASRLSAGAIATTLTWTGATGDGQFSNPLNWDGGKAPVGDGSENLVFNATSHRFTNSIFLGTSPAVNNLIFTGAYQYYFLNPATNDGGITIGLGGDLTVSSSGSLFAYIWPGVELSLTSGTHVVDVAAMSSLALFQVSGPGDLVKNGSGSLSLYGYSSSNFGRLTINAGAVVVDSSASLGSGPVTFNNGQLVANNGGDLVLTNDFSLGATPTFDTSDYGSFFLTGTFTALVQKVALRATGESALRLQGNLVEGPAGTAYTFSGDNTIVLEGTNTYTGGTWVEGSSAEIPELIFYNDRSLPTTGLIHSSTSTYVGLGSPSATARFLSQLDAGGVHGAIGFDSDPDFAPQTFSANLDFSRLTDPSIYIGTLTTAIVTGTITPPADADRYNFGGHGGFIVENSTPLTGNRSVHATTYGNSDTPFMLVLRGSATNDYTGATSADGAGIVFDAPGALPAESPLVFGDIGTQPGGNVTSPGSYLGITENAGLTPAQFVARISQTSHSTDSVIGFDSTSILDALLQSKTESIAPPTEHVVNNLDLSSLGGSIYVGSATGAVLTGTLTTTDDDTSDYFFTGYSGGKLVVDSRLTGERSVTIGLPNVSNHDDDDNAVTLTGDNDYTHGTTLLSGKLALDRSSTGLPGAVASGPLGTGALNVSSYSGNSVLAFGSATTVLANDISLQSSLTVESSNSAGVTLSGVISGYGTLKFDSPNPITLSNNANGYQGGTHIEQGTVTAAADHALGNGSVYLNNGADLTFTSAAPKIFGLSGGYANDSDEANVTLASGSALTIEQNWQDSFYGNLTGAPSNGAKLIKDGSGELTLYGHGGYTGGTRIDAGALVAGSTDALGTGTITLNGGTLGVAKGVELGNAITFGTTGGTLGGNGTYTGPVAIGTNAHLSPGESPGLMTFTGGLTWSSGGTYDVQVQFASGGAGSGYDSIAVTGSLTFNATLGAPFTINLLSVDSSGYNGFANFDPSLPYTWMIVTTTTGFTDGTNPLTAFDSSLFLNTTGFANSLNGGTFSLDLSPDKTSLLVNFTPAAVPEPSTWALLLTGLAALAFVTRRRRS